MGLEADRSGLHAEKITSGNSWERQEEKMNLLRIALLQILPQGSLEENRQKGICACIEAKKAGADIALFPEMWSNGYHVPEYRIGYG